MDYLEKLEEEKLTIKWSLLGGAGILIVALLVELSMGFLGGGMAAWGLLSLPALTLFCGGLIIVSGIYRMIKQYFNPPNPSSQTEEKFKNKLILGAGGVFILSALAMFLIMAIAPGRIIFSMSLSIPRLFMIIGGGIFLYGACKGIKSLFSGIGNTGKKVGNSIKNSLNGLFSKKEPKQISPVKSRKAIPVSSLRMEPGELRKRNDVVPVENRYNENK